MSSRHKFSIVFKAVIILLCMAGVMSVRTPDAGAVTGKVPVAGAPADTSAAVILLQPPQSDERGPVPFDHDVHTAAVADCVVCHGSFDTPRPDPFAYAVQGKKAVVRSVTDNDFHTSCIGCHATRDKGPQSALCGDCHLENAASALYGENAATTRFKPRFDRETHALHTSSPAVLPVGSVEKTAKETPDAISSVRPENCTACHHPVKNAEGRMVETYTSCRTCHGRISGILPYKQAAHQTCVLCHERLAGSATPSATASATASAAPPSDTAMQPADAVAPPTGPIRCAGCHDAAVWASYQKIIPAPMLAAGQPVSVLMQPEAMPGVPFNHNLHEKALPSCVVCHHRGIQSCGSCHLTGGEQKRTITEKTDLNADAPSLYAAMHRRDASRSCVGCHEQRQTKYPECAGCHGMMPATAAGDCGFCHRIPAASPAPAFASEITLEAVAPDNLPTAPRALPETVSIGTLSSRFEPVEFPHAAILSAMQQGIHAAAPALTARHAGQAVCAACHHRAPLAVDGTPPACVACHAPGEPRVQSASAMLSGNNGPALQQASHQQCMGCHERMGITRPADTDCAGCHAAK